MFIPAYSEKKEIRTPTTFFLQPIIIPRVCGCTFQPHKCVSHFSPSVHSSHCSAASLLIVAVCPSFTHLSFLLIVLQPLRHHLSGAQLLPHKLGKDLSSCQIGATSQQWWGQLDEIAFPFPVYVNRKWKCDNAGLWLSINWKQNISGLDIFSSRVRTCMCTFFYLLHTVNATFQSTCNCCVTTQIQP